MLGGGRQEAWARLGEPWDVIVIGGGITGAAIARNAAQDGLRTLLVEQCDFAWGASSRSSKLIHGGLRYMWHGGLSLVRDAVGERERLLTEALGLVEPQGFVYLAHRGDRPRVINRAALALYDLLAGRHTSRSYRLLDVLERVPRVDSSALTGGLGYDEARVDDARLVLRVLSEAVAAGAVALNYVAAEQLLWRDDRVAGVRVRNGLEERTAEVYGRTVLNATGAWADRLRGQTGVPGRIRALRGSHLVFPAWRLPVAQGISVRHPSDRRYVSIVPWEGVTLVGTTDLDHDQALGDEPHIAPGEVAYLMAAVTAQFPTLELTLDDVLSAWSGVRAVIAGGKSDPSTEGRDHAVWQDAGLVTVSGGKLTTFRLMARDALAATGLWHLDHPRPTFERAVPDRLASINLSEGARWRLAGRYGADAAAVVAAAPGELHEVPGTPYLWVELRWAARTEGVVHLDDLLLRRVRIGLIVPHGGAALLPDIRAVCQAELGWDDRRWDAEETRYLDLWRTAYSLPEYSSIPDWRPGLMDAGGLGVISSGASAPRSPRTWSSMSGRIAAVALASATAAGVGLALARRRQQNDGQGTRTS